MSERADDQSGPDDQSGGEDRSEHARSFDRAAALYAAARPDYPAAALDWLLPQETRRVLDLGAGTGKLTVQLVEAGLQVTAVEPSSSMLAQLRRALPDVEAHKAPAEAIPAADGTFDAVLVAQAFHWFNGVAALTEIARVLRPGGVVGLLWNSYDDRVDWVAQLAEATANAARVSLRSPHIPELAEFGPGEKREFAHVQRVTRDGLRDLVQTHSGYLVADADRRIELLADVDRVLAEHPDLRGLTQLDVPYETLCWRAVRR